MPDYFATMGVPVVAGREFTLDDVRGRPEVVIVSEELARLHWPGEDPIGKRLNILDQPDSLYSTVVGVVPAIRIAGIEEAKQPQIYMPMLQRTQRTVSYVVRGSADPLALLPGVRAAVGEFNASLPVARVAPMQQLVERSFAARRFNAALLGIFAAVALLLASVGLYGVVSYLVAQRNRELGLRLALGSTPHALTRLVVADGMRMALAGIVLGLIGASLASRALQGLLFGVSRGDPWTYTLVAILLATVAFFASWLPARRVTRISPVEAMRGE
jgi:predicted permease